MGSRGRGSTERQGSGTRSGTGRFVPAGSGSNPPEHAHSLHSTTQGAHRSGSRLRTIPRRSFIGRPGKIKAIEELVSHPEKITVKGSRMGGPRLMRSGRARRRTHEGLASKFAALRWVAIGTKRTCQWRCAMSAFGGQSRHASRMASGLLMTCRRSEFVRL
jgi:hypothetical protein